MRVGCFNVSKQWRGYFKQWVTRCCNTCAGMVVAAAGVSASLCQVRRRAAVAGLAGSAAAAVRGGAPVSRLSVDVGRPLQRQRSVVVLSSHVSRRQRKMARHRPLLLLQLLALVGYC